MPVFKVRDGEAQRQVVCNERCASHRLQHSTNRLLYIADDGLKEISLVRLFTLFTAAVFHRYL